MKWRACWWLALVLSGALQAADPTNAPPPKASAPAPGGLLTVKPSDLPQDAQPLQRLGTMLSKKPTGASPDVLRDWLTAAVVRCEQFLAERKDSPRINEVRALDAQYRFELATLTEDQAEMNKAVRLARQVIAKNDKDDSALLAREVLLQAAWPDNFSEINEQAKRIARDFPGRSQGAGGLWTLVRVHQRKGDEKALRETAIELFGAFPKSPEAGQARALIKQLPLLGHPVFGATVKTVDAQTMDVGSLRNQAVVLDFWTAETAATTEGVAMLRRLYQQYRGSGLTVIGINLDANRATFDKARAVNPTPWPQCYGREEPNSKVLELCRVEHAPTRILIDPFGLVARLALHPAELEAQMKRWQTAGAFAPPPKPASVATEPPKPAKPIRVARATTTTAKKTTVTKEPKKEAKKAEKPKEKTKPVIVSRSANDSTSTRPVAPPPQPAVSPMPTPAARPAAPPSVAPSPTHQEIGGVVYAKPLPSQTNLYSRSMSIAAPKSPSSSSGYTTKKADEPIGQLFAKTGIPVPKEVADRSEAEAKKKAAAEAARVQSKPSGYPRSKPSGYPSSKPKQATTPPPTPKKIEPPKKTEVVKKPEAPEKTETAKKPEPPKRTSSGYSSSTAKPKPSKKEGPETLADMPDITEADRRAALSAAAMKILKSEEELMSWTELEGLFGTKNPASPEGRLAWYQDMADRCQQFVKDFSDSSHANIVRINEGRCRLVLYQAKKDPAQRARAEVVSRQVLANKPSEDDAIRAEFVLLNSSWPDRAEQGVAVAKRIVKDFPHRREAAAAMLMHAQFRRRQGFLRSAKAVAEELLKQYPSSEFAFNAKSLITQCDLLQQPCPSLKLTGLQGEAMNTDAMRGKPFLIEFWSASGKSAEEDTAKLFQLYLKYHPKGFEIFTICVDKSREAMDIFQLHHAIPWPRFWDGQGMNSAVALRFGVDTTPMRFLVEPTAHRVVSSHISPEGIAHALDLWIDKGQPPPPPGQENQAPGISGFFRKFFGF